MENKIYDIIPPEKKRKVLKERKKKKSHSKEFLVGIFLFIVVVLLFVYFQLPEAEINIQVKTESLSFKEVLIAGEDISTEKIEVEKESWLHEVESTGVITEEIKARGTIKVYNEHRPARDLNLIAGTRFLSNEGKYFVSPNRITVPAGGVTEIEVVAKEAGEDYNIGPSDFSIPGLAGTEYYHSLYGRTEEGISGGMIGETRYVTEEDINQAEEKLKEKLLEEIGEELEKFSDKFEILREATSRQISDLTALVESGDRVDNFAVRGDIRAEALVYEKNDFINLIKEKINSKIEGKKILEESLEIEYLRKDVDLEEGKIVLEIEVFVEVYSEKDNQEIINLIEGKREEEIKTKIKSEYEDVLRVEVDFYPFWTRRLPRNKDKVNIDLIIE